MRALRLIVLGSATTLLGGCSMVLMDPAGDVATRERDLIIASTVLMLLIIVPVMAATLIFAWRYRESNTEARYDPDFHHSTQLEVLIWTAPLLIIVALGALTWIGSHVLDPFRPIGRTDAARPMVLQARPLTVDVVALDWKWLFFYPDQKIATINELAAPVDMPIEFRITSATVMNSFFVPALAGQIYAMAGMQTKLNAIANRAGVYDGFSANYSGAGFSRMSFKFHALPPQDFDGWVAKVRAQGTALDAAVYKDLEKPSEQEPVRYFSPAQEDLYQSILNLCAAPGKMCMSEMNTIDTAGGGGKDSEANHERLLYDGHRALEGGEEPGATFPASGRPPNTNVQPQGMKPDALSPNVNQQKTQPDGEQGHDMPGMDHGSPAPAQLHKN